MAIAFGTAGTAAVGTTSLAVPHPSSIAAGDLLILVISNKYPNNGPSTPADWTLPANAQGSGGQGSAGIDTGTVYCTVFTKIATGSESGNLSVTLTSANASVGRMFRYTKAAGATWDIAAANGADNSGGATSWSVTAGANPGLTAGDMLVMGSAINTDGYTYSAQAVSATGVSAWGTVTERQDSGTTQGQDCGLVVSEHPVSTGTASAAPVFTMTASSSATSNPAGASVFLRLREVTITQKSATLAAAGSTTSTLAAIRVFVRALAVTLSTVATLLWQKVRQIAIASAGAATATLTPAPKQKDGALSATGGTAATLVAQRRTSVALAASGTTTATLAPRRVLFVSLSASGSTTATAGAEKYEEEETYRTYQPAACRGRGRGPSRR